MIEVSRRRNSSIYEKIRNVFFMVVLLALIVSNGLVFLLLSGTFSNEISSNYKNICDNVALQMEVNLASVEDLATMICSDTTLQKLIQSYKNYEGYMYYRSTREIGTELGRFATLKSELIDDIYFCDVDGMSISRHAYYDGTSESEWYKEFLSKGKNAGFSYVHEVDQRDNASSGDARSIVTYIVEMNSLSSGSSHLKRMGYILINIKLDTLMRELEAFDELRYEAFDEYGRRIAGNCDLETISGDMERRRTVKMNRGANLYISEVIPRTTWNLVTKISVSVLYRSFIYAAVITLGISAIMILISKKVIQVLSKGITEPLNHVASSMDAFSNGDFSIRAAVSSGDEIEQIASVFNEMVDSIQEQMHQNLQKEKEKRKAEVGFLMAQIKPHFIYNCLNSIIYLARQGKTDDIILFTRAFISLLQASIKRRPQEEIMLVSEIKCLRNYLLLMSYRYGYSPIFESEIGKDCEGITLPALILQPLIENSILHGSEPGNPVRRITVRAERTGKLVQIHVIDNGAGMSPEKLEELRENLRKRSELTEHIGLSNVNERLKLCYGEQSGLQIESREQEGTDIWFELEREVNDDQKYRECK